MDITFNAKEFIDAVSWVVKVTSRDGIILMDANPDSTIRFRAEGDAGMRSMTLNVHEDTPPRKVITYPLLAPHLDRAAKALMKKRADGDATISLGDEAVLSYDRLRFPVSMMASSGRLPSDSERFSPIGSADYHEFMDSLKMAAGLTGNQMSTSAVDLTFDGDASTVSVAATDKTAMVMLTIPFIPADGYHPQKPSRFLILPDTGLRADTDTVEISESPESMRLEFGIGKIATIRKQQMKKFPFGRLLEQVHAKISGQGVISFDADVRDVATSADIAVMLSGPAGEKSPTEGILTLNLKGDELTVQSNSATTPVDSIPVDHSGSDKVMHLNYDELRKALGAISSERMRTRYADEDTPLVMTPISQDGAEDDSTILVVYTPVVE